MNETKTTRTDCPADIGAQCFAEDLATLGQPAIDLLDPWRDGNWSAGDVWMILDMRPDAPAGDAVKEWSAGYRQAAFAAALADNRRTFLIKMGGDALGGCPHDLASDTVRVDLHGAPAWDAQAADVAILGESFLGLTADEELELGERLLCEWVEAYGPESAQVLLPPVTDDSDTAVDEMNHYER